MKLLALDTSTLSLSLALLARQDAGGHDVVDEVVRGAPERQSELLPGVIGEALTRSGWSLASLDALIIGLGPGSFTGLRIGLATLKALAYAMKKPLVGVSSLAALALAGAEDVPLFTVAVARRDDLYLGRYRRRGAEVELLAPETALSPRELAELLVATPEAVALGPAIADYREKLVGFGAPADRLSDSAPFPLARHLAALATIPAAQPLEALFSLEPHYVRSSGAEANPQFPPLPGPAPTARLKE